MKFDLSRIKFSKSDTNKNIVLPERMNSDLAEEIGLHIGDGSMNIYYNKGRKGLFQLRGHIRDDKKHYQNRVRELYKKLYNINVNIREMKSTGVIGFQIWSDAIVNFKNQIFGLPLGKKCNITIPEIIQYKKYFFSFMRGLFDTDGCVYIENKNEKPYPRIEIATTSKPLCLQIVTLLRKYRINVSYYEYKRKELNWNNLYTIALRGFLSLNKWFEIIGSNNPKHIVKYNLILRNKWLR